MGAELTAAMNKVRQVLNHYKAFKDIEEALAVAADSERMVVELGLQADALKIAVGNLEAVKVDLENKIGDQAEAASLAFAAANAELDKVLEAKKAEIAAAEDHAAILEADAQSWAGHFKAAKREAEERLGVLAADEGAATKRLVAIEAKIAELKGM